jgi:hypothetical protein
LIAVIFTVFYLFLISELIFSVLSGYFSSHEEALGYRFFFLIFNLDFLLLN